MALRAQGWALAAIIAAPLAACGDYGADYPDLVPAEQLLVPPALPGHAQDAAASPDAAQGALQASHRGLSAAAVAGGPQTGDLAARAGDLRARAEALRRRSP